MLWLTLRVGLFLFLVVLPKVREVGSSWTSRILVRESHDQQSLTGPRRLIEIVRRTIETTNTTSTTEL